MNKKYLTVDQAQQRLPDLRRYLRQLVKIENSLDIAEAVEIEYDEFFEYLTHQTTMNKTYHKLWFDYYKTLEKIHIMGAVVKDVRKGLVDFFSLHDGREILLCWHYDEEKINHWHEMEDDVTQRKPVSQLQIQRRKSKV